MIGVKDWQKQPGEILPTPLCIDDRAKFPEELVRNVLAWLEKEKEKLLAVHKPTDQIISPAGSRFIDPVSGQIPALVGVPGIRAFEFESGTAEVLLRHTKSRAILGRYHFVTAREVHQNLFILGPELYRVQEGQIQ